MEFIESPKCSGCIATPSPKARLNGDVFLYVNMDGAGRKSAPKKGERFCDEIGAVGGDGWIGTSEGIFECGLKIEAIA